MNKKKNKKQKTHLLMDGSAVEEERDGHWWRGLMWYDNPPILHNQSPVPIYLAAGCMRQAK